MNKLSKSKLIIAAACVVKVVIAFAVIASLPACATRPVTFAQKDPHVDLYAFKTFAFFTPAEGERGRAGYTTLVGERLKAATCAQMERLGYVYDASNPDLRVNITLMVQQRAEVRSVPSARPLPYGAWRASSVETVDYREGTLAIDLVDAQRRTMVWRGVAQDRITRKDMRSTEEAIREAVREVFARYPRRV